MNHSSALRFGPVLLALALFLPSLSPAAQNSPITPEERKKLASDTRPSSGDATPVQLAPNPGSFALEIRHGYILDNEQHPVAEATLGNILDYLKKRDNNFSLSLGPGAADVRISDLLLRFPQFEIHAICDGLVSASGGKLNATNYGDNLLSLALTDGEQTRELAVFNLTNYLNPDGKADDKAIQDKIASVSDIIFKTLSDLDPSFGDATQPHYQFHKGANLLVVTGTHEDIHVATQVINALTKPTDREATIQDVVSKWAQADPAAARQLVSDRANTDSTKVLQLLADLPQGTNESATAELNLMVDALHHRLDQGDTSAQTRDMILQLQSLSKTYSPMHPKIHQAIQDAKNILSQPISTIGGGGSSSGNASR